MPEAVYTKPRMMLGEPKSVRLTVKRFLMLFTIKPTGRGPSSHPWRSVSGATRQSLAENAVSRFKALAGVKLAARGFENQQVYALVKCRVLNRMAFVGLPVSERVLQG